MMHLLQIHLLSLAPDNVRVLVLCIFQARLIQAQYASEISHMIPLLMLCEMAFYGITPSIYLKVGFTFLIRPEIIF